MIFDQSMPAIVSLKRYRVNRQSGSIRHHNCDMESVGSRLRQARKLRGLTQPELAKRSGVSQTTISDLERGRNDSSRELVALARALDCSPDWLSDGRGPGPGAERNIASGPDVRGMLPLISWVAAGKWCESPDGCHRDDAEEWFPVHRSHGPNAYLLRVQGDSMLNPSARPSFASDDLICVDPDREFRHGSLVIAKLPGEQEATFKRLLIDGDRRYLQALNPAWPDRIVALPEGARICGVVFGKREDV